jgi:protein-disulfide isomerase
LPIASKLASLLALVLCLGGWSGCRDSSASSSSAGQASASAQPSAQPKEIVLPGVDTSAMTARERHEWSALVSELYAPCANVPVSVATCVLEKRPCGGCAKAAKWIATAVRDGAGEDLVRRAYKDRFDPASAKTLPLDGSPTKGPADAPVTIVEFADFECPHCRMAVPLVDAVLDAHPGKVRLVYKFVSLPMHVHAEPAARAAFAAGQQGKFWEMEHLLFERQEHLEDADLERYAKILKLDIAQWKLDMSSTATKDRVAQDQKLEQDLKLKGTPTIYVNGRELDIEADESLEERVASELGVPPAAESASAAGSSSAPPASPSAPPAPTPTPTKAGASAAASSAKAR